MNNNTYPTTNSELRDELEAKLLALKTVANEDSARFFDNKFGVRRISDDFFVTYAFASMVNTGSLEKTVNFLLTNINAEQESELDHNPSLRYQPLQPRK